MRGRNAYPKPLDRYIFFAGRGVSSSVQSSCCVAQPKFSRIERDANSVHTNQNAPYNDLMGSQINHALQSNHHVKDQTAQAVVSVTNLKQLFLYSKLFFTFCNLFFRLYFQNVLKHKK